SGIIRTWPTSTRSSGCGEQLSGCWPTGTLFRRSPMPRKTKPPGETRLTRFPALARELAAELKASSAAGQPLIEEEEYRTGAIRVQVIWDKWDHVPLEERSLIILRAYELAGEMEKKERITLVTGLTVPEAHASGLLPVQILPAVRKTDP